MEVADDIALALQISNHGGRRFFRLGHEESVPVSVAIPMRFEAWKRMLCSGGSVYLVAWVLLSTLLAQGFMFLRELLFCP